MRSSLSPTAKETGAFWVSMRGGQAAKNPQRQLVLQLLSFPKGVKTEILGGGDSGNGL